VTYSSTVYMYRLLNAAPDCKSMGPGALQEMMASLFYKTIVQQDLHITVLNCAA